MQPKKSRVQGGGWSSERGPSKPTYQPKAANNAPKSTPNQTTPEPKQVTKAVTTLPNPKQLKFPHLVVHSSKSPYDVYIGRPNPKHTGACKWGNPFKIPQDGDRETVISKYHDWLLNTPEGQQVLAEAKIELKGKILGCFCAPLACHGNVLAELVNGDVPKETIPAPLNFKNMKNYSILCDGCVLIRNAFTIPEQQLMVNEILRYARGEIPGTGSFYVRADMQEITFQEGYADPLIEHSDPKSGILNLRTKARMNVPYSSETSDKQTVGVWDMCHEILNNARLLCPSIPDLNPNIWRLNYYKNKGKIGWHFDRHPKISMDLQHTVKAPVVSMSLGCAGQFDYRPLTPTPNVAKADDFVSLRLESGDLILFGGPARQLVHRVPNIFPGTCPAGLDLKECTGRLNFGFYEN